MFEDINQETTRRLTEVHSILRLIKDEGISIDKRILKGLFFVLLYGALEYVIQASVQRCIILLNRKNTPINNFRYSLLDLILNKECNAVSSTSNKQWIKRYELFIKLNEITPINNIDEALFPCPTGNIKYKNIRDNFNAGKFDSSLNEADELLKMNLKEEEKKEVETIKSTSETKVAEAKAKAEQEAAAARQKAIDEAIKVNASTLYEEFNTNNVGAENKYKGKMLLVTGTVYNIDKTFFLGTAYVNLMAGYVADGVTAYFSSEGKSQITNVSQGQTITVLGRCSGRSLGSAILNDCVLVN